VYLGAVTFYYLRLAGDERLVVMEQNQTPRAPGAGHTVGSVVYAGWDADSTLALGQG
jgi:hypothetical protein